MTRRPNTSKTDLSRVLSVLDKRGERWEAIKVNPGGEVLVLRGATTFGSPASEIEEERFVTTEAQSSRRTAF